MKEMKAEMATQYGDLVHSQTEGYSSKQMASPPS